MRYEGDRIGEPDEDGIARWYLKCKVRKEGNVYIATPHTTNPCQRSVRKQQQIAVSVHEDQYRLEQAPHAHPFPDKTTDYSSEPAALGQDVESLDKGPHNGKEEQKDDSDQIRLTTHKQVFDELYHKFSDLKPHEQKQAIFEAILPLFQSELTAQYFVQEHWRRKRRNLEVRRKRFAFKAYNQAFEYFFTITYDDQKHNEQSFEKSLKSAFSNLHKRYGCLFQGVWERGNENKRLHFHGLILDPNRKILNGLVKVSDYNPKTGRKKTYLQSNFFADKFGRNEFSKIIPQMYDSAVRYITKYLSKQDVKPYYSKGLYRFIESDICGDDVLCKIDDGSGRDIRLVVANDFNIWQEGELIGRVSPETLAKVPQLP